jgi:hypothetical protein
MVSEPEPVQPFSHIHRSYPKTAIRALYNPSAADAGCVCRVRTRYVLRFAPELMIAFISIPYCAAGPSIRRVAQPVMRFSRTANTSYMVIAITLMTVRPANTNGIRICEPANIMR